MCKNFKIIIRMVQISFRRKRLPRRSVSDCSRLVNFLYRKQSEKYSANAPVTRPYICQRTPTHGDTSDKLGARFIQVKSTSRTFFISYANIHIVRNTVSNMSWLENCLIVELYVAKYAGVTPASMGPGL